MVSLIFQNFLSLWVRATGHPFWGQNLLGKKLKFFCDLCSYSEPSDPKHVKLGMVATNDLGYSLCNFRFFRWLGPFRSSPHRSSGWHRPTRPMPMPVDVQFFFISCLTPQRVEVTAWKFNSTFPWPFLTPTPRFTIPGFFPWEQGGRTFWINFEKN